MSKRPLVALVGEETDCLTRALAQCLAGRGWQLARVETARLATARLSLDADGVRLDGRTLTAAVFRATPEDQLAAEFVEADVGFASSEARAIWLAVLTHPSVMPLNRPDAELWYTNCEWGVWYRRMSEAGVPTVPLSVGGNQTGEDRWWMPWGGGCGLAPKQSAARALASATMRRLPLSTVLWCAGEFLPDHGQGLEAAAEVLEACGTRLAELTIDDAGRVISCTTRPAVDSSVVATPAARKVVEVMDGDLHRR